MGAEKGVFEQRDPREGREKKVEVYREVGRAQSQKLQGLGPVLVVLKYSLGLPWWRSG